MFLSLSLLKFLSPSLLRTLTLGLEFFLPFSSIGNYRAWPRLFLPFPQVVTLELQLSDLTSSPHLYRYRLRPHPYSSATTIIGPARTSSQSTRPQPPIHFPSKPLSPACTNESHPPVHLSSPSAPFPSPAAVRLAPPDPVGTPLEFFFPAGLRHSQASLATSLYHLLFTQA